MTTDGVHEVYDPYSGRAAACTTCLRLVAGARASLNLDFESLRHPCICALERCSALTELHVRSSNLRNEGALAASRCTRLTYLDASNSGVGTDGAVALATLPALRTLHLDHCNVDARGAVALAELADCLTTLSLNDTRIGDEGLAALAGCARLQRLYARYNAIGDAGAAGIARSTTLQVLDLSGNVVRDAGAGALGSARALTDLDIGHNLCGSAGVAALVAAHAARDRTAASLTRLDARRNAIGDAGAAAMLDCETLTDLNLSVNLIGDVGIAALGRLTRLKALCIIGNGFGRAGLAGLAACSSLQALDAATCAAPGDDFGISVLRALPRLTTLDASHNNVRPNQLGALLEGATALTRLRLHNAFHVPARLTLLEHVRALHRGAGALTTLIVSCNAICDDEAAVLAALPHVTALDVSYCTIGPRGAACFAGASGRVLTRLHLGHNPIGSDGVVALFGSPVLTHLDITQTGADACSACVQDSLAHNFTLVRLHVASGACSTRRYSGVLRELLRGRAHVLAARARSAAWAARVPLWALRAIGALIAAPAAQFPNLFHYPAL